jgi:hypothetical protein
MPASIAEECGGTPSLLASGKTLTRPLPKGEVFWAGWKPNPTMATQPPQSSTYHSRALLIQSDLSVARERG